MNEDQWKVDPTTENEQPENKAEEQPAGETEGAAIEDIYETQSRQDIYTTPSTESIGTGGVFSGYQNQSDYGSPNNPYQNQPYGMQGNVYQNQPYGTQGNVYQDQPYGTQGNVYQDQPYGTQGNVYQDQSYGTQGNPYQNQAYDTQGNPYQNQSYDTQGNPYQNQSYGTQGNPCQNQSYGTQGNPYQNQSYGTQGNLYQNQPYGTQGSYNNPYSPYAVPGQHKKHTGLIIGVIVGIIILFLIAIFAVIYYALKNINGRIRNDSYVYDRDYEYFDEYDFDYDDHDDNDNWRHDRRRNEYFKDDDYDDDQGKYDEYYELEDALRYDLSYSVSWEYYEYEPENDEDVIILVEYPVIEGDLVPNLDRINDLIYEEVDFITDYYEDDYSGYMGEDSYFYGYAMAYVTYMDEDVLSIVYSEEIDCDYYPYVNLYCINIDMRNGVVMDNTELLDIDDDFSVDFRNRSEKQNGSISGLDYMSDQTITGYLTDSSSLIIFYTPLGMEIGMNYDEGWVTVTYKDYEQYLKIF